MKLSRIFARPVIPYLLLTMFVEQATIGQMGIRFDQGKDITISLPTSQIR